MINFHQQLTVGLLYSITIINIPTGETYTNIRVGGVGTSTTTKYLHM